MSGNIQTLTPEVIHLIAAGEVIDSIAAAIRELVENALDAAATRIVISLYPDLWRVQVADNGQGMSLRDLQNCSLPHSTSKIYTKDDLWKITSLGFRGEALHSLAQVGELEIASRLATDSETSGWHITYDRQGKPETVTASAIAPGTIVTVANLFGDLPVRRKGLPALPQQMKSIQQIVRHIALCHPHITWQIQQNEKPWFQISPATNSHQILPQILPQVKTSDLQSIALEIDTPQDLDFPATVPKSQIELVLGLPDRCHRRRADWIKVAVNGRIVRSPQLEQTMLSAFARTLPRDRYPICFLHLKLCPSQIDWNRHPAKSEIYLQSLPFWQERVANAIERALRISPIDLADTASNRRIGKLLKASEAKSSYQLNSPPVLTKTSSAIGLLELRAVAQVRKTYIVAEHPAGLWLVEQHIAHERVLYERLEDEWQLVSLESPLVLSELSAKQLEQLDRLGLVVEPFGEQLWAVRSAPQMLVQCPDLRDALIELSWGGDLQTAQVATACRSAIRNGTPLSLEEMQTLLDWWKVTRNPRTCPHGRPIYLSLEESSLARFFRRHWVIGKSHGLES